MITVHRFSLYLQQTLRAAMQKSDYCFSRLEVVTDNAILVNSIRLLIILLALMMAYNTPSKHKNEVSESKKFETVEKSMHTGFEVKAITKLLSRSYIR